MRLLAIPCHYNEAFLAGFWGSIRVEVATVMWCNSSSTFVGSLFIIPVQPYSIVDLRSATIKVKDHIADHMCTSVKELL